MNSRMSSPMRGFDYGFYSNPTTADSEGRAHSLQRSRRSPSPTEYFKYCDLRVEQMENKVYQLNEFIYKGIDKFLDKQAVRNLITDYNEDHLYGENFWDNFDSELEVKKESPTYANLLHLDRKADLDKARNSFNSQMAQKKQKKSWMDLFLGLIQFKIFTSNHVQRRNFSIDHTLDQFNEDHHLKPTNISCFAMV